MSGYLSPPSTEKYNYFLHQAISYMMKIRKITGSWDKIKNNAIYQEFYKSSPVIKNNAIYQEFYNHHLYLMQDCIIKQIERTNKRS